MADVIGLSRNAVDKQYRWSDWRPAFDTGFPSLRWLLLLRQAITHQHIVWVF